MFNKEIINILLRQEKENIEELNGINDALADIKLYINDIYMKMATNFAEQSRNYKIDKTLLQDMEILANFIQEFDKNLLSIDEPAMDIYNKNSKSLNLYLSPDNICPECGYNMEEKSFYYSIFPDKAGKIFGYKCQVCGRLYITPDIINSIENIKQTNIIVHYNYLHMLDIYDTIIIQDSTIVLKTVKNCQDKGHLLYDVTAQVPVLDNTGTIKLLKYVQAIVNNVKSILC